MAVLKVQDLKKVFKKGKIEFTAVNGVSFQIEQGECLGLVGESGCGKSTIAKMVTGMIKPTEGAISLLGKDITFLKGRARRDTYQDLQMVFQMPADSFNPRITLGSTISEAMTNFGLPKKQAKEKTAHLLELVGLKADFASRYPHQVSGGQCQRAAIARAIANDPKLVICDEATSALDVSVQAQIITLLIDLQKKLNMSYLFICHDLALVENICNRVLVMNRGNIVEEGTADQVINHPQNAYTKLLLKSVFPVIPDENWQIPDYDIAE